LGWISPNDLMSDPNRWLDVPHEHHEILTKLMSKLFKLDWKKTLEEHGVHCLLCDGVDLVNATEKETGVPVTIDGWVEKPIRLLHVRRR